MVDQDREPPGEAPPTPDAAPEQTAAPEDTAAREVPDAEPEEPALKSAKRKRRWKIVIYVVVAFHLLGFVSSIDAVMRRRRI